MNSVPKDVRELISKELSIRDFLSYCSTSKKMCPDDGIWRRRGEKDYGNIIKYSPFNTYKERYLFITKTIFKFIDGVILDFFLENFDYLKISEEFENIIKVSLFNYIVRQFQTKQFVSSLLSIIDNDVKTKKADYLKHFPFTYQIKIFYSLNNIILDLAEILNVTIEDINDDDIEDIEQ